MAHSLGNLQSNCSCNTSSRTAILRMAKNNRKINKSNHLWLVPLVPQCTHAYSARRPQPWEALDLHNGKLYEQQIENGAHGFVAHEQYNNQMRKKCFIFCRLFASLLSRVIFSSWWQLADIFCLRVSIMLCAESIATLHSAHSTHI